MKRAIVLTVLLALVLSGCASATSQESPAAGRDMAESGGYAPAEPLAPDYAAESSDEYYGTGAGDTAPRRLVIQNADMSIVVVKPLEALNAIKAMASEFGGFVVNSYSRTVTTDQDLEVIEANITIRVDSTRLDTVMERIRALTPNAEEDVLSENVSGQDVTKEYVDLESQLRNLKQTETQLQAIMEKATETEDVLAVYRDLTSIREQIEVKTGQMKYYEEAAALSSVSVYIQAQEAVAPLKLGNWQPVGTARNAVQALLDTLQFLGRAAIWIVIVVIPVGLIICLPIWLIVRAIRRGRNKVKAARVVETPAEPKK